MDKGKKTLGLLFVAVVAFLLATVVHEEIRTVIKDTTQEYSVSEFVETSGGLHRSSLIIISAYDVSYSRYEAKSFLESCKCSKHYAMLPGETKACSVIEIPTIYPAVIDNKNVNLSTIATVLEAPVSFKDGENVLLDCLTTDR